MIASSRGVMRVVSFCPWVRLRPRGTFGQPLGRAPTHSPNGVLVFYRAYEGLAKTDGNVCGSVTSPLPSPCEVSGVGTPCALGCDELALCDIRILGGHLFLLHAPQRAVSVPTFQPRVRAVVLMVDSTVTHGFVLGWACSMWAVPHWLHVMWARHCGPFALMSTIRVLQGCGSGRGRRLLRGRCA